MPPESIVEVLYGGRGAADKQALGLAARQLSDDPYLASRCRLAGRRLVRKSPIEYLLDLARHENAFFRCAGALAGSGATTREMSLLLRAARDELDAVRACRRAFRGASRRRRANVQGGPPRNAYFETRLGGSIELPTLRWPLSSPESKEYTIALWARAERLPRGDGEVYELARLATRDGLGIIVSLRRRQEIVDGDGANVILCVEAAHAPRSGGRVSQQIEVPVNCQTGAWHQYHIEARGRARLSLFGVDDLSAWFDAELVLDRGSMVFPTAVRGGCLDDCAIGRGFQGQIAAPIVVAECSVALRDALFAAGRHPTHPQRQTRRRPRIASNTTRVQARSSSSRRACSDDDLDDVLADVAVVAFYDARHARGNKAVDASPHRRHAQLAGGAAAFATPDALESLSALGGVGLVVSLFDRFVRSHDEDEDSHKSTSPSSSSGPRCPASVLVSTLAACVESCELHASELARLGGIRIIERMLADSKRAASSRLIDELLGLRRAAALCPPLAAQVTTRLFFSTIWPSPGDSRDDGVDEEFCLAHSHSIVCVTHASPASVDLLVGVPGLLARVRLASEESTRKALLAAVGIIVADQGVDERDAAALLGAISLGKHEDTCPRDVAVARDTSRLVLVLLSRNIGVYAALVTSLKNTADNQASKQQACGLDAFIVAALVDRKSEQLRDVGVRLLTASLLAHKPSARERFDAIAPFLFDALTRRSNEVDQDTYTALVEMIASLNFDDDEDAFEDVSEEAWAEVADASPRVLTEDLYVPEEHENNEGDDDDDDLWTRDPPVLEVPSSREETLEEYGQKSRARRLAKRWQLETAAEQRRALADLLVNEWDPTTIAEPIDKIVKDARLRAASALGLLLRLMPFLRPALGLRFLNDMRVLLINNFARLAANQDTVTCVLALTTNKGDDNETEVEERFKLAMYVYSALVCDLLARPPGAAAISLSVAIVSTRQSQRPTLRAALSHVFASLLRLPCEHSTTRLFQTHVARLIFVACALVPNRKASSSDYRIVFESDTVRVDDNEDLASVLLAVQAREVAGAFLLGGRSLGARISTLTPGGGRAIAPSRLDESARRSAKSWLFSSDSSLLGQSVLVFELLRLCAMVVLGALDPCTAEAAANVGWTRFLLATVIDVCDNEAKSRIGGLDASFLLFMLSSYGDATERIDSLDTEKRESVAWTLATVAALRDALRSARSIYFLDERSLTSSAVAAPNRRAAAIIFAREACAALRDALTRRHSPVPRFLDSVTDLRHMLDEASICSQVARSLGVDDDEERRARDGQRTSKWHHAEELDEALYIAAFDESAGDCKEIDPRRLTELRWMRCAWLGDDGAASRDAERFSSVGERVARAAYSTGIEGLAHFAQAGAESSKRRTDLLAAQNTTSRVRLHACAYRDAYSVDIDASLQRERGDASADARIARRALRRLRNSVNRPEWSPFSVDVSDEERDGPKRLRFSTTHRDAFARRPLLVRQPKFETHASAAYDSRERNDGCGDMRSGESSSPSVKASPLEDCSTSSSDYSDVEGPIRAVSDEWSEPIARIATYDVHMVKPSCAVQGTLILTARYLFFLSGQHRKLRWRLDCLTSLRGRRYLLRRTALEFFFVNRREVFIAFETPMDRRICWRLMKRHSHMPIVAHPPGGTASLRDARIELRVSRITYRWQRREISNFEYLMALNTFAGRTYNDLAQYFVFPWIIADYESERLPDDLSSLFPRIALRQSLKRRLERKPRPTRIEAEEDESDKVEQLWSRQQLDTILRQSPSSIDEDGVEDGDLAASGQFLLSEQQEPSSTDISQLAASSLSEQSSFYRDLRKPVGALDARRLDLFKERFESVPFMYGSHYSSAGIVLHYLVRLEPFTSLALELQGGAFDCGDRLFFDVAASWRNGTSSMSDVKELVPEFFYMPEIFRNVNRYPLGELQSGVKVDDVTLPPWALGDSETFVRINRAALERRDSDFLLPRWIDLIFGCLQRGAVAEKAQNVFHPLTYEGAVDLDAIEDETLRDAARAQITHFGQIPLRLFNSRHPKREPPGSQNAVPPSLFDETSFARSYDYAISRLYPAPQPEEHRPAVQEIAVVETEEKVVEDELVELDLNSDDDDSRKSQTVTFWDTAATLADGLIPRHLRLEEPRPPPRKESVGSSTEIAPQQQSSNDAPLVSIGILNSTSRLVLVDAAQTAVVVRVPKKQGDSMRIESRRRLPTSQLRLCRMGEDGEVRFGKQYGLGLSVAGSSSSYENATTATPPKYARRQGVATTPHWGGVRVDVAGAPGMMDPMRLMSVGYLDGSVRCHGLLSSDDGIPTRRRGASRGCGATCISVAECGRIVATGHEDGTTTIWVNDFVDLANALASDDALVAAAKGHAQGVGAAALYASCLPAVRSGGDDALYNKRRRKRDMSGCAASSSDEDERLRSSLSVIDSRLVSEFSLRRRRHGAKRAERSEFDDKARRAFRNALRDRRIPPSESPPLSAVHVLRGSDLPIVDVATRSDSDVVVSAKSDGSLVLHTVRRGRFVRILGRELTTRETSSNHLCELSKEAVIVSALEPSSASRGDNDEKDRLGTLLRTFSLNDARPTSRLEYPSGRTLGIVAIAVTPAVAVFCCTTPSVLVVARIHDLNARFEIDISGYGTPSCLSFSPGQDRLYVGTRRGFLLACDKSPSSSSSSSTPPQPGGTSSFSPAREAERQQG